MFLEFTPCYSPRFGCVVLTGVNGCMTIDPTLPSPDDHEQRRHDAKVHNDRVKFIADIGKLTIGALIVGGVVRFFVDPNAPAASVLQLLLTFGAAGLLGLGVWIVLGRQRLED